MTAALIHALRLRARLYQTIRAFFAERHVMEVETPMLSDAGNTEPNIESFSTRFTGHADAGIARRWLRTSPEYPLKRLLATGIGDCYELGRVFRNGEAGGRHNPEFTLLEWYRVGWDHLRLIDETVALVHVTLALVGRQARLCALTYRELFVEALSIDPFSASLAELQAPLRTIRIDAANLTRDDWLGLLMTHRIEPTFPRDRITVVRDWPASQCALARIRPGDPPVAERFELYLGRFELANGYHELRDPVEQEARFQRDLSIRKVRGQQAVPIDYRFLHALERMPACAGVAMGIDRLLMALTDAETIRDVLAFDFRQA